MSDIRPAFEISDTDGSTEHHNINITTTPQSIPSVAGNVISELIIFVPPQNGNPNISADISFDGGSNYFSVFKGGSFAWTPKGGVTQVTVKSSDVDLDIQVLINFEAY